MKGLFFLTMMMMLSAHAVALETRELTIQPAGGRDDLVAIWRGPHGELMLRDALTTPVTLFELARRPTHHETLAGLAADDHPQYLTAHRHDAAHDSVTNNALEITGDVGGNSTLGGHVADRTIHLDSSVEEVIAAPWRFGAGVRIDGSVALRDLTAITLEVEAVGAVAAGDVLRLRGLNGDTLRVSRLEAVYTGAPVLLALQSLGNGERGPALLEGIATIVAAPGTVAGAGLAWNGTGFVAGTPVLAVALEDADTSGRLTAWVGR